MGGGGRGVCREKERGSWWGRRHKKSFSVSVCCASDVCSIHGHREDGPRTPQPSGDGGDVATALVAALSREDMVVLCED